MMDANTNGTTTTKNHLMLGDSMRWGIATHRGEKAAGS